MAAPSIREMKDALIAVGVSFADCSEKAELVARYQRAMADKASRARAAAPPKAPPRAKVPTPSAKTSQASRAPAPRKQLSAEDMGKAADGSDGGELGREIRRVCKSKDFYAVLKVERACKEEDLKKAYRKLALRLHPDKCSLTGAEEAFKKVSTAFSCLNDSQQRASYDIHGEEVVMGRRSRSGGPEVDLEELFRTFCAAGTRGGFKVENVKAALQRNPWVIIVVLAMLPQLIFIVMALMKMILLLLLPLLFVGYNLTPIHQREKLRKRLFPRS